MCYVFFFFNDTATTEIYTLSLHDALPIYRHARMAAFPDRRVLRRQAERVPAHRSQDRKSTRLNSSHTVISYAVFCLKKKKKQNIAQSIPYLTNITVNTNLRYSLQCIHSSL